MKAVVSGRSGLALLLENDELVSIDLAAPDQVVRRNPAEVPYLFGEATDLQFLEDVDRDDVLARLEQEVAIKESLDLSLILLDPAMPSRLREEGSAELDRAFATRFVEFGLQAILFATPLPASADLSGALRCCREVSCGKAFTFLKTLGELQDFIREIRQAWESLPDHLFGRAEDRTYVHSQFVFQGLFRDLVLARADQDSPDVFLFASLGNPIVKSVPNHRAILQGLIAPFREKQRLTKPLERERSDDEQDLEESSKPHLQSLDRAKAFAKVKAQKDAIVKAMQQRDLARVSDYLEELVDYQSGSPIFIAKSLCDLAMEAQRLGMASMALQLTQRSIQLAPEDQWAKRQHANALLRAGKLREALDAFALATHEDPASTMAKCGHGAALRALNRLSEALNVYQSLIEEHPENLVARSGRAEVLKALGRLPEALAAYDTLIAGHPEQAFAKNGRAEVLKASGRLPEALDAYSQIIVEHPEDVVAKGGRAEVLKALGRLPEALAAYDATIAEHSDNHFAKNGRAGVLKTLNRLPQALAAYNAVIAEYPEDLVAKCGRAEVLKALNRLPEALSAYDAVIAEHPEDVFSKNGRAEVLRRLNRLPEALSAYDAVIAEHPEDTFAKNGRAAVLKALNRLPGALSAYDSIIAEHPESVVAKSGRAEVLKALNRLPEALAAYDSIIAEHPESVVAKSGRAEVLKALNRLPEALTAYDSIIAEHPESIVARSGRAEVLKALNRLPEALAAYDSIVAEHPENAVAKSGRAEVLKALNRLPEALTAYENAASEHPEDLVIRNGRACVLAALGRWNEALAILPKRKPVVAEDWIAYHIRGMIYLRKGNTAHARQIFEQGLNAGLPAQQVDYFRTAFVVSRLHDADYVRARDVLLEVKTPSLQAAVDVLAIHTFGALRKKKLALDAYKRASRTASPQTADLTAELKRRYIDGKKPTRNRTWLLEREIETLLLAA